MTESVSHEMLPQERQRLIIERLARQGRVLAATLAAEWQVSEDSIRRDLRDLAARGLCKRVYGGALPLSGPVAVPLKQRRIERVEVKRALAGAAAKLVRRGHTLLIDAGSTNIAIAAALPTNFGLTVVTNAPDIAQVLCEREGDLEILLIGGRVDPRSGAAIGAQAMRQLAEVRADLCFPGACAVDVEQGLWGVNSEEALFKRGMVESSGETVVVATNDKFNASARHRVVGIRDVQHLVVEHDADEAACAVYAEHGVSVHRATRPTD